MALPGSGQISLNDIQTEFGGSNPIALSEYYGKGNAPASGEIQLAADFYGTANTYTVEYLVVAGGGGGAGIYNFAGGGGGAGGFRTGTGFTVSPGTTYTVTVGAGGAGNAASGEENTARGQNGNDSVFSTITSAGGGGGASELQMPPTNVPAGNAQPGGSGGGGSVSTGNNPSATGVPGGTGNTHIRRGWRWRLLRAIRITRPTRWYRRWRSRWRWS